eukprot:gnl/MRDRNA2_/MRDRNA2_93628_c0_seq1.p1 gnl/MRDRNA2_/MRDRNA2_93628_c0~~gnl/MRDRNA2_/MRDRNA2_93628_c0_seq1.p1  ORF type:complete len:343 (+),score=63.62 gnl/MRDRNA2_/MRDRNA2_93628_c0_seq1:44-1072(+)
MASETAPQLLSCFDGPPPISPEGLRTSCLGDSPGHLRYLSKTREVPSSPVRTRRALSAPSGSRGRKEEKLVFPLASGPAGLQAAVDLACEKQIPLVILTDVICQSLGLELTAPVTIEGARLKSTRRPKLVLREVVATGPRAVVDISGVEIQCLSPVPTDAAILATKLAKVKMSDVAVSRYNRGIGVRAEAGAEVSLDHCEVSECGELGIEAETAVLDMSHCVVHSINGTGVSVRRLSPGTSRVGSMRGTKIMNVTGTCAAALYLRGAGVTPESFAIEGCQFGAAVTVGSKARCVPGLSPKKESRGSSKSPRKSPKKDALRKDKFKQALGHQWGQTTLPSFQH